MQNMKLRATYKGDSLRNLVRQYGIDRMKIDPKFRREVRAALKKKRAAAKEREAHKAAKQASKNTTPSKAQ